MATIRDLDRRNGDNSPGAVAGTSAFGDMRSFDLFDCHKASSVVVHPNDGVTSRRQGDRIPPVSAWSIKYRALTNKRYMVDEPYEFFRRRSRQVPWSNHKENGRM